MEQPTIRAEHTVEETLERFPALATQFVTRGMACVGCVMAPFDTLRDAARAYGREPEGFIADLNAAISATA